MRKISKTSARQPLPVEAIKGKQWVSRALNAVIGMWQDRRHVDPVKWQRQVRRDWERNSKLRSR